MREATAHLIDAGCTRIAFVAGPSTTSTGERRLAGYRAAVRAAGSRQQSPRVIRGDFRVHGGYAATRELLMGWDVPDGLLVSNNLMTIGALQAVGELGVRLPEDLLLVGFDGFSWARALAPTVTVVEQPTYEIGQRAATLLLDRIRGKHGPPRKVVLPGELQVGDSSRPVDRAGDRVR